MMVAAGAACMDSYVMDIRVDPAAHVLSGTSRITWTNSSSVPAYDLWLHLYPNAFESTRTTLWRESPSLKIQESFGTEAFSRMTLKEARLEGEGRALEARFERPDDGNPDDRTVAVLALPHPIAPGATAVLNLAWETKLHRYYFRSGYGGDSLFLMQWYPKLGVFMDGKWICHQFHAFTEFFSDFSDYAVILHLPAGWTAAATGTVAESASDGGTRIELKAENVHDVAVALSRSMKKVEQVFHPRQGNPVKMMLYLPEEYLYKQHRIFTTLSRVFHFMEDWVGPYLWDQFTVVSPPWPAAQGHGGMEYPQLIVCGVRHFNASGDPGPDYVLMHEFIHQYFYGMIATNEVDHPWMDEGFTTYLAERCLREQTARWAPDISILGAPLQLKSVDMDPLAQINWNYYRAPQLEEMGKPGWTYAGYEAYRNNAYNKPALALATLEQYAGTEAMKGFLRDYFSKYAFSHPGPAEVEDLLAQHFGSHWSALFGQLLKKPSTVDYRVLDAGSHSCVIGYQGDLVLPVEVRVRFSDGTRQSFTYDPGERTRRYEFPDKTVVSVEVDPERRLLLDTDPRNNTRLVSPPLFPDFGFLFVRIAHLLEQFACAF